MAAAAVRLQVRQGKDESCSKDVDGSREPAVASRMRALTSTFGGAKQPGKQLAMLGLTQLSNYLTLKGSFSAVSKPNFARKYAFCSMFQDLQYL